MSATDERIQVIEQVHTGAGAARNAGLDQARGEYLLFLDSDDRFSPMLMVEKSWAKAKETRADIVIFDAVCFDMETGKELDSDGIGLLAMQHWVAS